MATLIQTHENTFNSINPLLAHETKRIHLKKTLQAFVEDISLKKQESQQGIISVNSPNPSNPRSVLLEQYGNS